LPGVELLNRTFFNEFSLRLPNNATAVVEKLATQGILAGVPASRLEPNRPELDNVLVIAATEVNTDEDRAALVGALREVLS